MNNVAVHSQSADQARKNYTDLERLVAGTETETAIALIEEFTRQYPDFAQAHNDLAVLYYPAGNKLQTLGHYEKAVKTVPPEQYFQEKPCQLLFCRDGLG